MKFALGPHLAPGPDFGHHWFSICNCMKNESRILEKLQITEVCQSQVSLSVLLVYLILTNANIPSFLLPCLSILRFPSRIRLRRSLRKSSWECLSCAKIRVLSVSRWTLASFLMVLRYSVGCPQLLPHVPC